MYVLITAGWHNRWPRHVAPNKGMSWDAGHTQHQRKTIGSDTLLKIDERVTWVEQRQVEAQVRNDTGATIAGWHIAKNRRARHHHVTGTQRRVEIIKELTGALPSVASSSAHWLSNSAVRPRRSLPLLHTRYLPSSYTFASLLPTTTSTMST